MRYRAFRLNMRLVAQRETRFFMFLSVLSDTDRWELRITSKVVPASLISKSKTKTVLTTTSVIRLSITPLSKVERRSVTPEPQWLLLCIRPSNPRYNLILSDARCRHDVNHTKLLGVLYRCEVSTQRMTVSLSQSPDHGLRNIEVTSTVERNPATGTRCGPLDNMTPSCWSEQVSPISSLCVWKSSSSGQSHHGTKKCRQSQRLHGGDDADVEDDDYLLQNDLLFFLLSVCSFSRPEPEKHQLLYTVDDTSDHKDSVP